MSTMTEPRKVHEGRNLKRIREILQVKQSALASELGNDWTQKKISQLEDKEVIEPELLEEIAHTLKVPVEAIKNFDEEKAIFNIQNNYEGSNTGVVNVAVQNYQCSFNPLERLMESIEENKKLYERLLEAEKSKVEMLERLLKEKK